MTRKKILMFSAILAFAMSASACGDDEPEIKPLPSPIETPDDPDTPDNPDTPDAPGQTTEKKLIVGYYPTWGTWWGEPDYDKMSMICLAFAEMRGDGHLYYNDIKNMGTTIKKARERGVKVLVSLRDAQNVSDALANPTLRHQLASEVKQAITELDIDGVDVDYEEWGGNDAVKRTNLEEFYKDIRAEIGSDKLLTAAVGGKTQLDPSIDESLLSHLDYVFPMIYDMCGGWEGGGWGTVGQHSSYEFFRDVIKFFTTTLNVPKEKLCPGVPFYGYEFKSSTSTAGAAGVAYRDILDRYPSENAHLKDNVGLIWYNGIPTIEKKSQLAVDEGVAGIMIWELTQDTKVADKSLLNTIYKTFNK